LAAAWSWSRDGGSGAVIVWPRGWEVVALLSRLIGFIVAILIIVWIVSNPAAAGDTVHGWITGLLTFFRHLA
jgi:hypothetical protein